MKNIVPFARIARCFGVLVLPHCILIAFPYPAQAEEQRVFVYSRCGIEVADEIDSSCHTDGRRQWHTQPRRLSAGDRHDSAVSVTKHLERERLCNDIP